MTVLVGIAACAGGIAGGYGYRKSVQEKKIGRTEEYAKKLLDDATRRADEQKKEMILVAKEEVLHLKTEADKEIRTRRNEIQRSERRLIQREEQLDKKEESLDKKRDQLSVREENLEKKEENDQGRLLRQERYSGAMSRSFYVGEQITEEDIKARFEDGVLRLTLPKKDARKVPEKKTILIDG